MKKMCLLLSASLLLTGCWETVKGEKVGSIVKCAKEGMFIKTEECELIRGGFNNASGVMGNSFHFTIEDRSLIEKAEKALSEQKEVRLKYHKEAVTLWRAESDNYFADEIEVM